MKREFPKRNSNRLHTCTAHELKNWEWFHDEGNSFAPLILAYGETEWKDSMV